MLIEAPRGVQRPPRSQGGEQTGPQLRRPRQTVVLQRCERQGCQCLHIGVSGRQLAGEPGAELFSGRIKTGDVAGLGRVLHPGDAVGWVHGHGAEDAEDGQLDPVVLLFHSGEPLQTLPDTIGLQFLLHLSLQSQDSHRIHRQLQYPHGQIPPARCQPHPCVPVQDLQQPLGQKAHEARQPQAVRVVQQVPSRAYGDLQLDLVTGVGQGEVEAADVVGPELVADAGGREAHPQGAAEVAEQPGLGVAAGGDGGRGELVAGYWVMADLLPVRLVAHRLHTLVSRLAYLKHLLAPPPPQLTQHLHRAFKPVLAAAPAGLQLGCVGLRGCFNEEVGDVLVVAGQPKKQPRHAREQGGLLGPFEGVDQGAEVHLAGVPVLHELSKAIGAVRQSPLAPTPSLELRFARRPVQAGSFEI
mmetsp:Transcript_57774/g.133440  ORF Transcript_57774/g.133440 Transcript_57774/m.133440 type:complete len:413 (+) Transcript_57774:1404-2642(+)